MLLFNQFRYKKGFSLSEILIAIALLGVILLIIMPLLSFEVTSKSVDNNLLATNIASSKLEELKKIPFSSLPPNGTTTFLHPELSKLPSGYGLIFVEDYLSTSSLKHISIIVGWQDNTNKTYKIDSIFYNK